MTNTKLKTSDKTNSNKENHSPPERGRRDPGVLILTEDLKVGEDG